MPRTAARGFQQLVMLTYADKQAFRALIARARAENLGTPRTWTVSRARFLSRSGNLAHVVSADPLTMFLPFHAFRFLNVIDSQGRSGQDVGSSEHRRDERPRVK
jgi:hypothetical protein